MSRWWQRKRQERDLDRELRFHIEQHIADLIAEGVAPEEAQRRARMELGGVEQVREECREVRPAHWLDRLRADLRFAVRGLRKHPGSAMAIALTLAVCIAVNTAVFTVVDSMLLRPLPFYGADRLVSLSNQYPKAGITDQDGSAAGDYYLDRRGAMPALAEHALYQFVSYPVEHGVAPQQMTGLAVTASYFPLLRVTPAQGRLFTEDEEEPGKDNSVILTHGLWRELFGGENAIGRELRMSGGNYTVAGVLPAGFRFVTPEIRYFVPLALGPEARQGRHSNNYRYLARLRDGATVEQAQAQVDALNAQVLDQIPQLRELLIGAGFHTRVNELQPWLVRQARPSIEILWTGALLVLLIGAVNLAGLALARASARAREIATRLALGATRGDLARQSLAENLLPALLGAGLGIAGGVLGLQAFDHGLLPGASEIRPGGMVILYAVAGALLTGVVVALMSQIPLRGAELARAIHDGGRGGTVRSTTLRRVLVAAQVGLAFVLLNGAGVLTASLHELGRVDPGFRVSDVWTASTMLSASYPGAAELRKAADDITAAARNLPGVEMAGAATAVPFSSGYNDSVIFAEGYVMKPGESVISPIQLRVTPGYLETMGIEVVAGRAFDGRDTDESQRAIIVDERVARRFWPDQDPVGRRMYFVAGPQAVAPPESEWMTVVGMVRSIRLENLAGTGNPNGIYYLPLAQRPQRALTIAWRGRGETAEVLRKELARIAPGIALFDVRSMAERQEQTLASRRVAQSLVLVFAGVAVLLAAIGIYGLLAFLLGQRQREIGIRMAVGCRPAGVFTLFLRDGLVLAGLGLLAGVGVAAAAKPWVESQLYGVGAVDPMVLAVVAAFLTAVAVGAVSLPAWRAMRVDPAKVLGEN